MATGSETDGQGGSCGVLIAEPGSTEGTDGSADWAQVLVSGVSHSAKALAMTDAIQFRQLAELARVRREQAAGEVAAARAARRAYWLDAEAVERAIADEVGAVLHLSTLAAGRRLALAETLVTRTPATLAALSAGVIDTARATRITEGISLLSGESAARAEAEVLRQAPDQTPGQVAASVRRAVIAADPAAADRAYQRAKQARSAECRAEDDGMASIWVSGTADRVARAWQTATAIAEHRRSQVMSQRHTAGARSDDPVDVPSLDQARADVILDLISSPDGLDHPGGSHATDADGRAGDARRPEVDVVVNVVVPLDSLGGHAGARPAEMAGHGPVPPAFVADLLGTNPSGPTDPSTTNSNPGNTSDPSATTDGRAAADRVRFTRWLVDPTGVVTAAGGKTFTAYRPPPTLDATVRARDLTCRFPGCNVPARHCDIDHTVPYPTGATAGTNLACLCRRHHRLKTHNRWRVRQLGGAVLEWTAPTGHKYRTCPPDWSTTPPAQPDKGRGASPVIGGRSTATGGCTSPPHACDQERPFPVTADPPPF